jgi:hypothetical protein
MSDTPEHEQRCSFCGLPEHLIRIDGSQPRLVRGPGGVAICDECVALCTDILNDMLASTPPGDTPMSNEQQDQPAAESDDDEQVARLLADAEREVRLSMQWGRLKTAKSSGGGKGKK